MPYLARLKLRKALTSDNGEGFKAALMPHLRRAGGLFLPHPIMTRVHPENPQKMVKLVNRLESNARAHSPASFSLINL